jgi:hypothetical protein
MIHVGSLDDPSHFEPQIELWLSDGFPWHSQNPNTMKFDGRPITGVKDRLDAYFAKRGSAFVFVPRNSGS